ncbi:hypothetical protein C8J56DRAFT_780223, partial [Mycena floridula]
TYIDPTILAFAYAHRSTNGIAHFLRVGRTTVRNLLLEHDIASPGLMSSNIWDLSNDDDDKEPNQQDNGDNLLDPTLPLPQNLPADLVLPQSNGNHPLPGYLSDISDSALDALIHSFRTHFSRAGISMLDRMLRRLGHQVPAERIHQSLLWIDPVHRIFDRIRIRWRGYTVPGPNALWHHDGQHGKSVHNVRIERLWVDVTAQVGNHWATLFELLEVRHGLNINNENHIWLLHHLFLPSINQHLQIFAEAWNNHRIQTRRGRGPNRTPIDMFGFDMLVYGVQGQQLSLDPEELELYGVDWDGLADDDIRRSHRNNNRIDEGSSSWLGRVGPPEHLNQVVVESPFTIFDQAHITELDAVVAPWIGMIDVNSVSAAWTHGLAYAHRIYGTNEF